MNAHSCTNLEISASAKTFLKTLTIDPLASTLSKICTQSAHKGLTNKRSSRQRIRGWTGEVGGGGRTSIPRVYIHLATRLEVCGAERW